MLRPSDTCLIYNFVWFIAMDLGLLGLFPCNRWSCLMHFLLQHCKLQMMWLLEINNHFPYFEIFMFLMLCSLSSILGCLCGAVQSAERLCVSPLFTPKQSAWTGSAGFGRHDHRSLLHPEVTTTRDSCLSLSLSVSLLQLIKASLRARLSTSALQRSAADPMPLKPQGLTRRRQRFTNKERRRAGTFLHFD